jgi:hypothetical protein
MLSTKAACGREKVGEVRDSRGVARRRVGMAKDHGPSIKDDEQYEKLREKGESKQKAARIANTTGRSTTGKRGGESLSYEEWSKKDLHNRAKEVGIEGRSMMDKGELIDALRNH